MEKNIGKYKILREIGKGGMGIVYKGLDPTNQKHVAIKVLPQSMVDRSMVERFNRESAAMVRLKHPNIVRAYEIGMTQGHHYFAMEYVEGENLKSIIKAKQRLDVDEALNIAVQVAEALAFAHREEGMSHRDIKPDNIIVKDDGLVKVMDYGLVQMPNLTRVTVQGSAVGTAEYMSPEQTTEEDVDTRTDIYSLGVTMYEMLTGHVPFQGERIQSILLKHKNEPAPPIKDSRPDIPEELEQIVRKAMAKNVAHRYQKAEELIEDIKKYKGADFIQTIKKRAAEQENVKEEKKDDIIRVAPPKKKSKKPIVFVIIIVTLGLGYHFRGELTSLLQKIESPLLEDDGNYDDQQDDLVKEADSHFQKLAQADDYHSRGLKYYREGLIEESVIEFKVAISLRPEYLKYYRDLALAYEELNEDDLALEVWQNLLRYKDIGKEADQAREHIQVIRGW